MTLIPQVLSFMVDDVGVGKQEQLACSKCYSRGIVVIEYDGYNRQQEGAVSSELLGRCLMHL